MSKNNQTTVLRQGVQKNKNDEIFVRWDAPSNIRYSVLVRSANVLVNKYGVPIHIYMRNQLWAKFLPGESYEQTLFSPSPSVEIDLSSVETPHSKKKSYTEQQIQDIQNENWFLNREISRYQFLQQTAGDRIYTY